MSNDSKPNYCQDTGVDLLIYRYLENQHVVMLWIEKPDGRPYFSNNPQDPYVNVWMNALCPNNGCYGAKAGVGIFWGNNWFSVEPDAPLHNVVGPLPGKTQTTKRSEYTAALFALEQAREAGVKDIRLHTPSELLHSTMTDFMWKWKNNAGYDGKVKKADGRAPDNQDLIQQLHGHVMHFCLKKWNVEFVLEKETYGSDMVERLARQGVKMETLARGREIELVND